MRLAVIPARGGSKRIPRKNIRPFCGKPMIAWSIEAAKESGCFDHIVVSTEDVEIAEIARAYGAELPFSRPVNLADDHTATVPVIAHAASECAAIYGLAETVCCLYATAPFVQAEDLQNGLTTLERTGADYVFSAAHFTSPIQRAMRESNGGFARMITPEFDQTRSQDLEAAYHDAGQFYWGSTQAWQEGRPILGGPRTAMYVLPSVRVQDIDTPDDWARAEAMFRALGMHGD
ncbi:MAG: pseudaminic acid cytidylyltransferase [Paracoccaceae bacterium]